jgi:hypothetical protein
LKYFTTSSKTIIAYIAGNQGLMQFIDESSENREVRTKPAPPPCFQALTDCVTSKSKEIAW